MRKVRSIMLMLLGVLVIAGPMFAQSYIVRHLQDHTLHSEHSEDHAEHLEIAGDSAAINMVAESEDCSNCEHCHCPMHCSTFAPHNAGVTGQVQWSFARVMLEPGFKSESLSYLANPDLDGPFQPPRA